MTRLLSPALLAVALLAGTALPASAKGGFDSTTLAAPAALAEGQAVHVAEPKLALALEVKRFDSRGRGDRPVRDADAQAKAQDLRRALEQRLSRRYTIAEAPGPGVLVIQPTLTWLASTRPTMADYSHQPGLSAHSVYTGGAEATFELSRDGVALGTLSDRHVGSFADGDPRIGLWSDADTAFRRWAAGLEDTLAAR